jgi:hypothetical protein
MVIRKFSNSSVAKILIVNQSINKCLKIDLQNVKEELVGPIGVSAARNIGIKWANEIKNLEATNYIYFWDEDIDIPQSLINKFEKGLLDNNFIDAYIFSIESYTGKKIGNTPFISNLLMFLNAYRLGNPHFIFSLNKIKYQFNENIGPGKKLLIAAEDTLFVLQNEFKNFVLLNDKFIHPEPESINSLQKIYEYSIAQGAILRKLRLTQKVIFTILVMIRPLIGFILNPKNYKLYCLRFKGFIYGIKKDINF